MELFRLLSSTCIKPNAAPVVKRTPARPSVRAFHFILVIMIGMLLTSAHAEPPGPAPLTPTIDEAQPPPVTEIDDEDPKAPRLPPIEARTYPMRVIRRSYSNKIYLLEDVNNQQPKIGTLLLLKQGEERFMAFRVLKQYPEKQAVAAKRIKRYRQHRKLEDGEAFTAIEKISDLDMSLSDRDKRDLLELEGQTGLLKPMPFDPELDSGTSPGPEIGEEDPDEDEYLALSIEESQEIDKHIHWLTAGFGYVRNNGPPGSSAYYFSAGNMRYALTLGRRILIRQPHVQDSLAIESGFYLYKSLSFINQGDSYTAVSFVGDVRYNIMFTESFGIFLYGGMARGLVIASNQSVDSGLAAFNSYLPAGGAGMLFQIGPSWYIRLDLGLDSTGMNLVLRF